MSLSSDNRERFRALVWKYRGIPGDYGLRPHTVEVGLGSWSGQQTGDGIENILWTPIVESNGLPPKVVWLTTEELAISQMNRGSLKVGPITPDFTLNGGGGTSVGTLLEGVASKQIRYIRIISPNYPVGALHLIQNVDLGSAFHYSIIAEPTAQFAQAQNLLTFEGNQLVEGQNPLLAQ